MCLLTGPHHATHHALQIICTRSAAHATNSSICPSLQRDRTSGRATRASDELPTVDQIFVDATHQRPALVERLIRAGIVPIAYRALAFLPVAEMAAEMGDGTHAALLELQEALGAASVQQAALVWLMRRGCHVLFKTGDAQRVAENMAAATLAASTDSTLFRAFGKEEALRDVDGSEMVAMCEGADACAGVWMAMAPPGAE